MITIETGVQIPKRYARRADMKHVKPVDCSAQHLIDLMKTLPMSLRDLSECSSVHEATVYRWLSGVARVPASVIRMLELMLVVDTPYSYEEN